MPERVLCGSDVSEQKTIGQLLCDQAAITPAAYLPSEDVRFLGRAVILTEGTDSDSSPWGERLIPVAVNEVEERWQHSGSILYPSERLPLTHSKGHFFADEGIASPYGAQIRCSLPIGCRSSRGVVREAPRGLVNQSLMDLQARADLDSPWGELIAPIGYFECDKFLWDDSKEDNQGLGPYYVDLFGRECAFCPTMFATFNRPCLTGAYQYGEGPVCNVAHPSRMYNSCGDGWEDSGEIECRPPEVWGEEDSYEYCNFGNLDRHSEDCVIRRLLGYLSTLILDNTDILSRVPMIPSTPNLTRWGRSSDNKCDSGCGSFGWEAKGFGLYQSDEKGEGARLRGIPIWGLDAERDGRKDSVVWPRGIHLWMIESNESDDCITPGLPAIAETIPTISDDPFRWPIFSCRPLCTWPLAACSEDRWCTSTHEFMWDREAPPLGDHLNRGGNRIKEAFVCFKQRELCDPAYGPCDSNPVQETSGPKAYYNPSSTTVVDVHVKVEIELSFIHWSPHRQPRCCSYDYGLESFRELVVVTITGEWCGPIAWGSEFAESWPGYVSDPPYPGSQNRAPGDPGSTYPASFCGNLFVNQGRYDDYWDDPASYPSTLERDVPKRCPSWLEGPKFWCPPFLTWTWKHTNVSTAIPLRNAQPASVQRTNECWAVEPVRMNNYGCVGTEVFRGNGGCTPDGCRRGCSTRDDSITYETPCAGRSGYKEGATPWGCDQCTNPIPLVEGVTNGRSY